MENGGYALCFNSWILDKNIKNELGLLLIISNLTAKTGICFASNKYFSELFGETEISISRKIKKLERLGHINIEYEKRGCQVIHRKIRLTKILIDDKQKNQSTINKNVKDNNTSNNITSNNIYLKEKSLISVNDYETEFEQFWKFYTPIKDSNGHFVAKGNKQNCLKKYIKTRKEGVSNETIMRGLEAYLKYCQTNNRQSCGAEVFINQRRFEADYGNDQCVDSTNARQNKNVSFIEECNAADRIRQNFRDSEFF